MTKAAIVILNFNGLKHLEKYLPLIVQNSPAAIPIYVIDNASVDESTSFISKFRPQISLIQLDKNYGFTGGYNRGLQQIEAEYFILINSDIVPNKNWTKSLIDILDADEKTAVVAPKILALESANHFEYAGAAGGFLDSLAYPFCRGRILNTIEKDNEQYNNEIEIAWAGGCAFIIRSELFNSFEGFDDNFFAHFEEIDLCWRLRRAGYSIKYTSKSTVQHLGGGTLAYGSPRKTYLNFRNSLLSLYRNKGRLSLVYFRMLLDVLAALLFISKGEFSNVVAIIKAHFYFHLNMTKLLRDKKYWNNKIKELSIGNSNISGEYIGYIIWDYYLRKKDTFTKIIDKV